MRAKHEGVHTVQNLTTVTLTESETFITITALSNAEAHYRKLRNAAEARGETNAAEYYRASMVACIAAQSAFTQAIAIGPESR